MSSPCHVPPAAGHSSSFLCLIKGGSQILAISWKYTGCTLDTVLRCVYDVSSVESGCFVLIFRSNFDLKSCFGHWFKNVSEEIRV